MFKEILISIIILISIFAVDSVTQNYTQTQADLLKENLNSIREAVLADKSKDVLLKKMDDIENKWDTTFKRMAYYIEHDELEKVETEITLIRSYIEMDDKTMTISSIDECSFIIEHISYKNSFNLQNIF